MNLTKTNFSLFSSKPAPVYALHLFTNEDDPAANWPEEANARHRNIVSFLEKERIAFVEGMQHIHPALSVPAFFCAPDTPEKVKFLKDYAFNTLNMHQLLHITSRSVAVLLPSGDQEVIGSSVVQISAMDAARNWQSYISVGAKHVGIE